MVYDNGQRDVAIESSTSFWVIPYTIIAILLITILILVIATRYILKAYVKRQVRKYRR